MWTSISLLTSCLVQFMEFAKGVCNKATDRGHWADYIDPCSGLPVGSCGLLTLSFSSQGGVAQYDAHCHALNGLQCLLADDAHRLYCAIWRSGWIFSAAWLSNSKCSWLQGHPLLVICCHIRCHANHDTARMQVMVCFDEQGPHDACRY